MQASIGPFVLLVFAVTVANLPFVSDRIFLVWSVSHKPLALRLLEVAFGYALVAVFALLLERHLHGSAYSQAWEFYAITICLFLVFAFPGFVFRYLWRQR
ncbi:DUF2818 family protein [Niveibacterium sp. 24ML]|uniref:DUF2818 family protein n=1 Tax=Niveibacterium sp. 24ML TaxID=2985512 RepID=UPI0022720E10|nr:DUF2818 family protein [Niveibacterium sp. 24ML]MCX9155194.1 DUF2818 family protein [Niveibacterium sp. 24ML]